MALRWQEQNLNQTSNPQQTPIPCPHRQAMGCLLRTDSHTLPSQTSYGMFIENRLPYLTSTDKLCDAYWEQTPIPHPHRQTMGWLLRTDSHTSPSPTSYGMFIENRLPHLALTDKLWDVYWEQTPIHRPQRQAMGCLLRTDSHTSPSQTSYGMFIENRLPYLALTDKLWGVYWEQTPIPRPHKQAMGCLLRTDSYLALTDKLWGIYWEQTPIPRPHRQAMWCLLRTDSHTSPSQTSYGVFSENRLPYLAITDKLWGVYWEQTPIPRHHRQAMWCLLRTDSHTSPSQTSYGVFIESIYESIDLIHICYNETSFALKASNYNTSLTDLGEAYVNEIQNWFW